MKDSTLMSNGLRAYSVDTAAVLFFMALEYGREVRIFTSDGIMMAVTMAMLLVLPYFVLGKYPRPTFAAWLIVRTCVGVLGLIVGGIFGMSVGAVLPGFMGSLPLTLLIAAAMISSYIQFYSLMKLRLVK